jgi:hypothetical protein
VDVSGIYIDDVDLNKPRWDKPYSEGQMTVFMSVGRGFFDVTRLRRYGLKGSLKLGTADGSPDPDCPCRNGTECPCNHWALTTYTKFSGLKVPFAYHMWGARCIRASPTRVFIPGCRGNI